MGKKILTGIVVCFWIFATANAWAGQVEYADVAISVNVFSTASEATCTTDSDCPSGFSCVGGICVEDTDPGPPCIATYLLGEDDPQLDILREYRDEQLATTGAGIQIIDLYYERSADLIELCERSPIMKRYSTQMLERAIAVIGSQL